MGRFPLIKKSNYIYRSLAPVAISQALNSFEALTNRDIYQNDNYLRGNLLFRTKKFTNNKKILKLSELIDSSSTVYLCSVINLCGCSLIIFAKNNTNLQALGSALILSNNKLLATRSSYGRDGADQMGSLILSYRLATSFIKDEDKSNDLFMKAVNFQTCLSYLVPGIAKAASNKWLRGSALEEILMTEAYGTSPVAMRIKKYPTLMKYLTWLTIAWEAGFPVIYILPKKYVPLTLHAVKGFHLGVALTMGLPRFFWGFMGAHASVEYVIRNKNNG